MDTHIARRRRRQPGPIVLLRYSPGDSLASAIFTGPANRTYIDQAGVLQTVGLNVPRDAHFIGGVRYLLLEGARTNHFLNSAAPVTQTTPSLTVGFYTISVVGGGTVTVSAGTATLTGAGVASAGVPVTFQVTVAGTVTYTVAGGPPTRVQVENGAFVSSYIATAGAAVTRTVENLVLPYTQPLQAMTVYMKQIDLGTSSLLARYWQFGSGGARLISSALSFGTDFQSTAPASGSPTGSNAPVFGDTFELNGRVQGNVSLQLSTSRNGGAEVSGVTGAAGVLPAAFGSTNVSIGSGGGGTFASNEGFAAYRKFLVILGVRGLPEMRTL